ncbi:MAG: hypoxanthine phosphoribosyltransferase [Leptospiraceae bacterium]|nr:hypoxanthine phosphoribosyltransferase [Leptospiraceae bacterium]
MQEESSSNHQLTSYIANDEIRSKVNYLAQRITNDFKDHSTNQGKELLLVGVLNGSLVFLADLIREIKIPILVDTIAACSYGSQTLSSGKVEITKKLSLDPRGKHIILVEDIVETGLTLEAIKEYLLTLGVQSVQICSLLFKQKKDAVKHSIDYLGFAIEDRFVVGYGLDYAGLYRNLPYIAELTFGA